MLSSAVLVCCTKTTPKDKPLSANEHAQPESDYAPLSANERAQLEQCVKGVSEAQSREVSDTQTFVEHCGGSVTSVGACLQSDLGLVPCVQKTSDFFCDKLSIDDWRSTKPQRRRQLLMQECGASHYGLDESNVDYLEVDWFILQRTAHWLAEARLRASTRDTGLFDELERTLRPLRFPLRMPAHTFGLSIPEGFGGWPDSAAFLVVKANTLQVVRAPEARVSNTGLVAPKELVVYHGSSIADADAALKLKVADHTAIGGGIGGALEPPSGAVLVAGKSLPAKRVLEVAHALQLTRVFFGVNYHDTMKQLNAYLAKSDDALGPDVTFYFIPEGLFLDFKGEEMNLLFRKEFDMIDFDGLSMHLEERSSEAPSYRVFVDERVTHGELTQLLEALPSHSNLAVQAKYLPQASIQGILNGSSHAK